MSIREGSADYGAPLGVGPSVRVDRSGSSFYVTSTPYPIHRAYVFRLTIRDGWLVTVETADVKSRVFPLGELPAALRHAGLIVGALYRVDMRSRFTGMQRFLMGRNLCPGRVACLDRQACKLRGDTHYHLCRGVPDGPNTVWCADHVDSIERPGFTGMQRFLMGRNLCPGRVACPSRQACELSGDTHYHLCRGVPDGPNTVWCADHVDSIERPGDVFRSISDSGGG